MHGKTFTPPATGAYVHTRWATQIIQGYLNGSPQWAGRLTMFIQINPRRNKIGQYSWQHKIVTSVDDNSSIQNKGPRSQLERSQYTGYTSVPRTPKCIPV
jgi:hypothetical protein